MAKTKKKKKSGGKKRRRVGGLNLKGGAGLKLLAVAGGFLLGDNINSMVSGVVDKIMPPAKNPDGTVNTNPDRTVQMVGQIGLGGLLLLKTKGMLPQVAGGVLAGAGLKLALKKMGVMKGYQNVPVIGRRRLAGYQNVPVIGGTPSQLAGLPGQLQGFKVNGGLGYNGYGSQGSGVMGTVMNPGLAAQNGSGITSSTGSGYMN